MSTITVTGNNNQVGNGNVSGNNNIVTIAKEQNSSLDPILKDFSEAIKIIEESDVQEVYKTSFLGIVKEAKEGVENKDDAKQQNAKNLFSQFKDIFIKNTPALFQLLANIATICQFFNMK